MLNFSDAKSEHLVVNSWTNLTPLWAGIPSKERSGHRISAAGIYSPGHGRDKFRS